MPEFFREAFSYFWHDESPYVLAMTALLVAILYRFRRDDRRTVVNTLGFFALSVLGQVASGAMHALGLTTAAEVVREASIIAGGVALIRLWGMLLFRLLLPWLRFAPPHILEDITVMLAYIGWGLVRLRYAGLHLSEIVTASAVITAVIAFSMQDTLGNVLGGIALQLDDSIKIGDWIRVDDVVGRVSDIRWRSTLLETRNWETVVVPNGLLMKGKFAVLGRRADRPVQWRRLIGFNVDYSAAPRRVIDTVEAAIRQAEVPNVAREPAPNVVLIEFDHGFGRYALRYWLTDLAQDDGTDTAVRTHVIAALQRAGMRLAVPESRVHTTKAGEKHEEAVRTRELARRLAALRRVDLFAKFSDEELHATAERLVYAPFARGAAIMRQGSTAHWLYVSTAGDVEVYAEAPGQARTLVGTLPPGSFFGEMGLMTGEPRTATVMAKTDVECYRLDKAAFEDIVQSRPSIAEEITQILIARRAALDGAMRQAGVRPDASGPVQQGELLARIRRFFGLAA